MASMSRDFDSPLQQSDEQAAKSIQRLINSSEGRRHTAALKKRVARQRKNEQRNAVTIQAIARGKKGRQSVSESRSKELAAIRIQSVHRGRVGRKRFAESVESLPLTLAMIKKGLMCHGEHPLLLRHTFLHLNAPSLNVKKLDLLEQYPHIMYLNIADNRVEDLNVLRHLPTLTQLNASKNCLTKCLDYAPPLCIDEAWSTGHTAVGSLLISADLSQNYISEIGELSHHPNLECLLLGTNNISTIAGLSKLSHLQVLDLSNNHIECIMGLDDLPIRELNLSGNKITSLKGLAKLPFLTALNVSANKIASLYPLADCRQLNYIDVSRNQCRSIRQVVYLRKLQWLKTLIFDGNPCSIKPFYRSRVAYFLPYLIQLDKMIISAEEKVRALNLYRSTDGDLDMRKDVFSKYFPNEPFVDYSPDFYDDELDCTMTELEADDGSDDVVYTTPDGMVSYFLEKAMKTVVLSS